MLSKNQVKYIHSLRIGKFRDEYRVFTVEGGKLVDELIGSSYKIHQIFATSSWIQSHHAKIASINIDTQEITDVELTKISNLVTPNEVFALVAYPDREIPVIKEPGDILLVLDCIQDPGNLGTIVRTADWFGIRNIICSPDTVDIYNPKVVQATMGSIFRVNIFYKPLKDFLEDIAKSHTVYGTTVSGENLFKTELTFPAVFVIGNESKGISPGLYPAITRKISIPGGSSGTESLNAGIAAGIVMAEVCRRR